MPGRRAVRRLYGQLLRPHLAMCVPIVVSVLLEMCFYSALPFSFRYIVDYGLLRHNHRFLVTLIGALAVSAAIVALASFLRDRLSARLNAFVLTDLRVAMFDHVQRLSMNFFSTHTVGDVMARFSTDLAVLESTASSFIAWAALPSLDVAAGTVLLFVLDWRLALIALLVFPLTITGPRLFAPRVAEESYRRKTEESRVLAFLQENVSAQVLVKTFDLADYSRRSFLERIGGLREGMIRVGTYSGLVERSSYVGIMLLQVGILGIGANMVASGALSVGALASFQALFLSISYSLASLTQFLPSVVEAAGGLRRVEELLTFQPAVSDGGTESVNGFAREIRFDGVSFNYSPDATSLRSASFSIPRGEYVAVVGSSGSGKSTVLNLLMRLYDPTEGAVLFDGVALPRLAMARLRQQFGYVPQESFLFNTSIGENIRLGNASATQREVEAAARAAEVHDFIMQMPMQYETPVGERGCRLSGGQRQRIALARAIVRNPSILVLDEATSALDPETEAAILATLERLRRGRTIVSVTHRLNAVVNADRILVLDQGMLVGQGRHRELLAFDGPYRRMWERQASFKLHGSHHRSEISLERLRQVSVFYGMEDELLAEAATLLRTEEFSRDRIVNRQGEYGGSLYIIARGTVELTTEISPGVPGRRTVLEEGDCFGEAALLSSQPETETARTLVPCIFLTMTRAHYGALRERAKASCHSA